MTTAINVYLKGGLEFDYITGDEGEPFAQFTGGCLYVSDGSTVTGFPAASVLYWTVDKASVEEAA